MHVWKPARPPARSRPRSPAPLHAQRNVTQRERTSLGAAASYQQQNHLGEQRTSGPVSKQNENTSVSTTTQEEEARAGVEHCRIPGERAAGGAQRAQRGSSGTDPDRTVTWRREHSRRFCRRNRATISPPVLARCSTEQKSAFGEQIVPHQLVSLDWNSMFNVGMWRKVQMFVRRPLTAQDQQQIHKLTRARAHVLLLKTKKVGRKHVSREVNEQPALAGTQTPEQGCSTFCLPNWGRFATRKLRAQRGQLSS